MAAGIIFFHPIMKPLASLTKAMPLSSYLFTVSGSPTTQAVVYRDPYLKVPFKGNPQADEAGNFQVIYLDPTVQYRVQLADLNGAVQYTLDPYLPPCPTLGTGPLQINTITGEVVITPPASTPISPTSGSLQVGRNGTFAISCPGQVMFPGFPLLQFSNALVTGVQTANIAGVANKPGSATATPTIWLPILGDGGIPYYIPLWS